MFFKMIWFWISTSVQGQGPFVSNSYQNIFTCSYSQNLLGLFYFEDKIMVKRTQINMSINSSKHPFCTWSHELINSMPPISFSNANLFFHHRVVVYLPMVFGRLCWHNLEPMNIVVMDQLERLVRLVWFSLASIVRTIIITWNRK